MMQQHRLPAVPPAACRAAARRLWSVVRGAVGADRRIGFAVVGRDGSRLRPAGAHRDPVADAADPAGGGGGPAADARGGARVRRHRAGRSAGPGDGSVPEPRAVRGDGAGEGDNGLDRDDVREVIRGAQIRIRHCFDLLRQNNPRVNEARISRADQDRAGGGGGGGRGHRLRAGGRHALPGACAPWCGRSTSRPPPARPS
ncbi:MAG: hypothetical protein MZV70_00315 [Desulfobacterales bacterium]|nr:hypothetical protein [Desulfobacterales bacterium]